MRILLVTETIPFPLDSGGRIKTFNTLRILSSEHEVHCHALVRDERHLRFESQLAQHCAKVSLHHVPRTRVSELACAMTSVATGRPFLVRRHFSPRVLGELERACQQHAYDLIYCDHLSMLEYGRRLTLPVVLDAHNVEFAIVRRHAATLRWSPLRPLAALEWRALRRYERRLYPRCRLIFSVSDVDRDEISRLTGGRSRVLAVPISVDAKAATGVPVLTDDPEVLFVGGLHWPPNADAVRFFVHDVFPRIRDVLPGVRLTVVGRGFEHVRTLVGDQPRVSFAGHVDDVEPYFRRSRVMVVPIRSGSGMRVKILDGLARGIPTVTTTVGCEGIDVEPGRHVMVADEPAAFGRAVLTLLQDRLLAESLAAEGRRLVLEKYDTGVIRRRVLEGLEGVAGARRPDSSGRD
jgi:glycosyltransferase involved in cell wall biosynthesis